MEGGCLSWPVSPKLEAFAMNAVIALVTKSEGWSSEELQPVNQD